MSLPFCKTLGRHVSWMVLMGSLGLSAPASRAAAPPDGKPSDSASKLIAQARLLLRQQQAPEAERLMRQCLQEEPDAAQCHLYLGAALAKSARIEEAATHYRDFVRLASPEDPEVPRVRQILEKYDQSRARK